jgi:hypothetical protein
MKNIKLKALLLTAICGIFGVMFGQSAWADEIVAKMESQTVYVDDSGTSGGTGEKTFSFKAGEEKQSYTAIKTAEAEGCNGEWEGTRQEFVIYLDGNKRTVTIPTSVDCQTAKTNFNNAAKNVGLTISKKANPDAEAPTNGTEKKSVELKYGSVKLSVDLIFAQNKQVEILCGKGTGAGPNEIVKLQVSQNQGSTKYTAETTALAGQCSGIGGEFIRQLKNAGFNVKDSIGNIGGDNTGSGTGNGGTSNGTTGTDTGSTGDGPVNQKTHADGATILTGCWNKAEASGKGEGIVCILTMVVDVLTVGIGVLGVLGITVVGIQYLTAGGSEEQTRKAKRRLFEIIIGLVGYVLIYALLKFLMPSF